MKTSKLLEILSVIQVQGDIYVNPGGEIIIEFSSQLEKCFHDYMKKKGFIYHNSEYIYRPKLRSKNERVKSSG